jgi:hypothetical protein
MNTHPTTDLLQPPCCLWSELPRRRALIPQTSIADHPACLDADDTPALRVEPVREIDLAGGAARQRVEQSRPEQP